MNDPATDPSTENARNKTPRNRRRRCTKHINLYCDSFSKAQQLGTTSPAWLRYDNGKQWKPCNDIVSCEILWICRHLTSDVVFPEKYFFGNFPENFWKFSKEKENIPHYLIYQKKSYEPQYHMSIHFCANLVLLAIQLREWQNEQCKLKIIQVLVVTFMTWTIKSLFIVCSLVNDLSKV